MTKTRDDRGGNPFAQNLRNIMRERNLTVSNVAKEINVSPQTIYKMLCGATAAPAPSTVAKLAAFLGVAPRRLWGEDVAETPPFAWPDADVLAQIPEVIGPDLEAAIERELPDTTPLRLAGPSADARQDILKMKLYLILKKRKKPTDVEKAKKD